MSYPTILTLLDGGAGSKAALQAALALAQRFGARLDLLAIGVVDAPLYVTEAYSTDLFRSTLDAAKLKAEAAKADAEEQAKSAGVPFDSALLATPFASVQEAIATRALYADLIVLSQKGEDPETTARLLDAAIFSAPTPLLLWPEGRDPALAGAIGRRAALAWDARPQASRAVRAALPLLAEAEAASVITVGREDDESLNDHGERLVAWLGRRGIASAARRLTGSPIGDIIHQDAVGRGDDLIVMGAYGHSQLREAIFGGVSESLIARSALPLFMNH